MKKFKLKVGDEVVVISGKNKGSKGKILSLDKNKDFFRVNNLNIQYKHAKPKNPNEKGEIKRIEGPIHYSNLMYFDSKTGNGEKIGYKIHLNGNKSRFLKKSKRDI